MRAKIEGFLDLMDLAGPGRFVGNHLDFFGSKRDEIQFANLEAVLQQPKFLPVESHQRGSDAINSDRMGACNNYSTGLRVRRHRAVSFARDDAVHHRQIAHRLFPWVPAAVEEEKTFV